VRPPRVFSFINSFKSSKFPLFLPILLQDGSLIKTFSISYIKNKKEKFKNRLFFKIDKNIKKREASASPDAGKATRCSSEISLLFLYNHPNL
jgi:hypothetical protein